MKTHVGVALIPVKPWSRAEVILDFIDGYLVTWSADGKWLGSWPANQVGTEAESQSRLLLILGTGRIPFELANPGSFRSALEDEINRLERMTAPERLRKAVFMRTLPPLGRDAFVRVGIVLRCTWHRLAMRSPYLLTVTRPGHKRLLSKEPLSRPMNTLPEREHVLRAELGSAQDDLVDAVRLAMDAWFGFYLRLAKGTGRERLESAIAGLKDASLEMTDIALRVSVVAQPETPEQKQVVDTYRKAVDDWAQAFDRIARGVELDQLHVVQAGFDLLVTAAEAIGGIALKELAPSTPSASAALEYLQHLEPPVKVSRKAMKKAKEPWKSAIVAAGRPLRWPDT